LADLKDGPDPLDIQSLELTVRQRVAALSDARERLADSSIRAPFGGTVAELSVKRGDSVSANAIIATLVTAQRIAEISLNEVDVARVRVGQRATLVFDAIPELTLTGAVSAVDTIGTVSSGVVSYTVEIGFDAQDERVKPGMSVTATIIIETKPDILLVPNAAVKTRGDERYVEIVDTPDVRRSGARRGVAVSEQPPRRQPIEIGTANDDVSEVVSGLGEGAVVVVGTVGVVNAQNTTNGQTRQQPGTFRIPGLPSGGGRTH
jgi:HlyD family secretion protein